MELPLFPPNQTLCFNREADQTIEQWLETHPPSQMINRAPGYRHLAVPHPNVTIQQYRQGLMNICYPRNLPIWRPIGFQVQNANHNQLLSVARANGVLKGYWIMFCENVHDWDLYWQALVLNFQTMPQLCYWSLECGQNENGGIIYIINNNFTRRADVIQLVEALKAVWVGLPAILAYYKPALYSKIGKYSRSGATTKSYIYSTWTTMNSVLKVEDGVDEAMMEVNRQYNLE